EFGIHPTEFPACGLGGTGTPACALWDTARSGCVTYFTARSGCVTGALGSFAGPMTPHRRHAFGQGPKQPPRNENRLSRGVPVGQIAAIEGHGLFLSCSTARSGCATGDRRPTLSRFGYRRGKQRR